MSDRRPAFRSRLEAIRGYGRPQRLVLLLIDAGLAGFLGLALYRATVHPDVPFREFLGVFWLRGALFAVGWVGLLYLQGAYRPRSAWSEAGEAWGVARATIWLALFGSLALLAMASDAGGGGLTLLLLFPIQGLSAIALRLLVRRLPALSAGAARGTVVAVRSGGPGQERLGPSLVPIVVVCLAGLLVSIMAFYPGWMSADSHYQYTQALYGSFGDWHPPLMQWWWSLLLPYYDGPALMLMQDLLLYWAAWGLLAAGLRYRIGALAYLVPIAGFWPGILLPLGQIWKDILFGCLLLAAWAILVHAQLSSRRPRWLERVLVLLFAALAVGSKTNGLAVLPFLFWYWVHAEGWFARRWFGQLGLAGALTVATVGLSQMPLLSLPTCPDSVTSLTLEWNGSGCRYQEHQIQYHQQYDLLGISVRTGQVLLPSYITDKAGDDVSELAAHYNTEHNGALAFTLGALTTDPAELEDLATRWRGALLDYPVEYLGHRWDHFWAMMRTGGDPAFVAMPGIVKNEFGFVFTPNRFSDALASTVQTWPWMYLPWLYGLALILAAAILVALRWHPAFVLAMSGSAVAFVLPHFFVLPATDYRYFYYAYLCTVLLSAVAVVQLLHRSRLVALLGSATTLARPRPPSGEGASPQERVSP